MPDVSETRDRTLRTAGVACCATCEHFHIWWGMQEMYCNRDPKVDVEPYQVCDLHERREG